MGYTYTTAIKGDDNTHTPDDPARHHYRNCSVTRSSPHTANRNFSWEESYASTVGYVLLEDCTFNRPVSLTARYPGLIHAIVRCSFEPGWLSNANYGTGSPLSVSAANVEDCIVNGWVTITQLGDIVVSNCRFASGMRHLIAPATSSILRLLNNVWNIEDKTPGQVLLSPPSGGGKLFLEFRGNRSPQGATKVTTARLSSVDRTGLILQSADNGIVTEFG